MRRTGWLQAVGMVALLVAVAPARDTQPRTDDEQAALLARIRAVGREGAGNAEAGRAWKELVQLGPRALPATLAAMDGADARACNWLRAAVDAIAERALAAGQPLPADRLEEFIRQKQHAPAARRLAYEWLCRVDDKAPARLLPGMLHDPSAELRRDAVAAVLRDADARRQKNDREGARAAYRKALSGACDKDQVETIARHLKDMGETVDLASHFGFVRRWQLISPFDNTKGRGFETAYPPEKSVDLAAALEGKAGATARWISYTTSDPYGVVDLNKVLGKQKGTVAYAYAVIDSPTERPVEVRAGSPNALKIFLNGKELLGRNEYHHGNQMDQHVAAGTLKAGRNVLLLKVCQNEQSDSWAQEWRFQVRLCDAAGAAVPFTEQTPGSKPGRP
jgi:hypothetical protein